MINNNIYEWLNNINNNNEQSTSITTTLIECILIISINGILIERQSLFDYCNSVIALNNSSDDNRYKVDKNSTPSSPYYYGLSSQQFQTIYNNINSISHNDINSSPGEYISNSSRINNSNKIKFNSSITIIFENNKCILNKQQNQQDNTTTMKSLVSYNSSDIRKKIKSCNCDNGGNNIDIIFFSVWRNIVIRNEILFHTRLYNLHFGREINFCFNEISTYKYKSYLDIIEIYDNDGDDGSGEYIIKPNLIPYGVSNIEFNCISQVTLESNSIPHSVTSVLFNYNTDQIFTKGILPDSIANLVFFNGKISNQSLDWLPSSLKTLSLGHRFQHDIALDELPESLTELKLYEDYKGKIVPGSIPLAAIKSLNYKFNSNGNQNELTNKSIPVTTTSLEFDDYFDQTIKKGYIPNNVSSIKFSYAFNSEIESGSLPESLKLLEFGGLYKRLVDVNLLPPNLTSIDMGAFDQALTSNLFPQSITSIKMERFDKPIPVGYFYNYSNLKSLKFNSFDHDIPEKTLPHSLTLLNLGRSFNNGNIKELPSSLSTFATRIESITHPLPSSITSLILLSLNSSWYITM